MNARRIGKWVIVLFLLAALPGMTAVMAQEEPAGKAPVMGGEAAIAPALAYTIQESEPNNSIAQADSMRLGDVMRGNLVDCRDFFAIQTNFAAPMALLIDLDAGAIGTPIDAEIRLYGEYGALLNTSDDAGEGTSWAALDPMLYNAGAGRPHFVEVVYHGTCPGRSAPYNLIVSTPLLISAAAANLGTGYVAGIPFRSEDVLAHSELQGGQEKWVLFLDGSDAGIVKNLTNLSTGWSNGVDTESSYLAVSFSANQTLTDSAGNSRTFKPQDWAMLHIAQVGPATYVDRFEYFPGAPRGLTTSGEIIDALHVDGERDGAYLYFSITGSGAVPRYDGGALRLADEDVFRGYVTNPPFNSMELDGSLLRGLAVEDVIAAEYDSQNDLDPDNELLYLTIAGVGNVLGHRVTQKDIFRLLYVDDWMNWEGIVWHGPDHGWNYNIDAFDFPQ